ncbi:helix-turn-helix domain-containing protein [Streptomyces sp. NPDC056144]|uniref:helix-turn-helix domain-containing protein n=1 Tax=unclassified Streptomyces TaxID=2593676 RepID=UPI0035DA346A
MTTAHQQRIPRQTAVPAARRARRRPGGLPEPGERRRLREQWGLSTRQVAAAFGVAPATVRSWERGRSAPRGSRREAYRRFLAGLAQHGELTGPAAGPRGADRGRVPASEVPRTAPRSAGPVAPALPRGASPQPPRSAASAAGGVGHVVLGRPGPDPVAPRRVRRLRLAGAAACVWSLALWLILTCPPPL